MKVNVDIKVSLFVNVYLHDSISAVMDLLRPEATRSII